jgi:hypothetical protein
MSSLYRKPEKGGIGFVLKHCSQDMVLKRQICDGCCRFTVASHSISSCQILVIKNFRFFCKPELRLEFKNIAAEFDFALPTATKEQIVMASVDAPIL